MFHRLREEFAIKPEDCPMFFLYDRDVLSYDRNELRGKYVKKYTNPYGTDEGYQGQLLLSYPSIESFLLSCITDDTINMSFKMGREVKNTLSQKVCSDEIVDKEDIHYKSVNLVFSEDTAVAENRLSHAVSEMDMGLSTIGISGYELDNLGPTLLDVYDYQQQKYNNEDTFSLLSLVGMALLELGVIVEL